MNTKLCDKYMTRKLTKSDFPRVCRTCLNFDNNKISLHTSGIVNMFKACTNLRINESDDLPSCICLTCYDKLNEFYSFKLKCEHFDRILRNVHSGNKDVLPNIKIENAVDKKVCFDVSPKLLERIVELSTDQQESDVVIAIISDENTVNHLESKQDGTNENIIEPTKETNLTTAKERDVPLGNNNLLQEIESHELEKNYEDNITKAESPLSVGDSTECNNKNDDQYDSDIPLQLLQNEEINVEDSYNSYKERKKRKELKQYKREKYLTPDKCDIDTLLCKICNKKLTTVHVLLRHIESHDEDRTFQCYCNVCNKGFYETGHLTKHMRRHKGETRYKCEECEKPFYELAALALHARKSHNAQRTRCSMCNKEFILKLQLDIHMETHRFRQTHTCEQCGNTFSNYWKLKSHLLKHSNERMYTCHVCSESFKRASALKNHQVKYHTEEKQKNYINCTICAKQITIENIKNHMMRRHSTEKSFQCQQCDKSYATEQILNCHRKMQHEGKYKQTKKTYLCPKCGKQLSNASLFHAHQQVHSGQKPFTCKYCNNTYKYRSGLDMHLKVHTGERPYECNVCQKRFKEMTTLRKHIYIHTGEKPYSCHICDKSFNQPSTLKTHMKVHGRALT